MSLGLLQLDHLFHCDRNDGNQLSQRQYLYRIFDGSWLQNDQLMIQPQDYLHSHGQLVLHSLLLGLKNTQMNENLAAQL
ncbi:hypothetical protein D3C79_738200 [compost metagenome]